MILVVPITPELPRRLRPSVLNGTILAFLLIFGFLNTRVILEKDLSFIDSLSEKIDNAPDHDPNEIIESELSRRPLLKIAPARGSWDLYRLLLANFVHGSTPHLLLNVLCALAGARLCATFLPLATILALFTLGGTLGLFLSMMLSGSQSAYIPHIGASAGIFSLMGAYYVYNFRFRTRYFFWFPTRNRYFLSLPTASFFFVDVLLVELILSTAQLIPHRWDNVDHFAHVFGFLGGAIIALLFRTVQRWPPFAQTRAEYFLLQLIRRRREAFTFADYLILLELNSFNDPLKCLVIEKVGEKSIHPTTEEITTYFRFISPTFMRYHLGPTVELLKAVFERDEALPKKWLQRLPYDLLIQIAYHMSDTPKKRLLLLRLFYGYLSANREKPQVTKRVERLVQHLESELGQERRSSRITN